MTRALLEQALSLSGYYESTWVGDLGDLEKLVQAAVEAIRAELAKPQDEPVAWMWQHEETGQTGFIDIPQLEAGWAQANPRLKVMFPVFTHPAHTEAEVQELLSSSDDNRYPDLCEDTIRRILGVNKP